MFSIASLSMNSMADYIWRRALWIDHALSRDFLRIRNFIFRRKASRTTIFMPGLLLFAVVILRRGRATSFSFSNFVFVWIGQKLNPPSFLGYKTCSSQLLVTVLIPICLASSCSSLHFGGKLCMRYTGYSVLLTMPIKFFFWSLNEFLVRKIHKFINYTGLLGFFKIMTSFYKTWGKLRLQIGVKECQNCS